MFLSRPCPAARVISVAAALLFSLGVASVASVAAQESAATPPSSSSPDTSSSPATSSSAGASEEDLVKQTLSLDISTASFYELADWLRSLGLSDSGAIAELRSRLYAHYGVKPPGSPAKGKSITIERAVAAEYFTVEGGDDSIIRISGGVVLTVRDEATGESQRLEADEIIYDKARNAVTARGHVAYKRTTASSSEEFSGQTLSVDLDDWAGVFLDGKMRRSGGASSGTSSTQGTASAAGAGTKERGFSFEADTILKRSGDLLVLDNGIVTACEAEAPHFSIRAKRLWLLGPNEWAIADAVLSLGEVPMIWIPFFFYPGEELVFHPVLGFREREGRFVQTTTYLIGSKPKSTSSSILSIAQVDASGRKKLRGVFLKPVEGAPEKESGATLKVMADLYSSLGACLGIVGNFPKAGPFEGLKLDIEVGLSRSIFSTSTGTGYSPYVSDGNWKSVWNESNFFSTTLPIRYAFNLSTTLKTGLGSTTLNLPFYSDRYFTDDFGDRSEDMDWIGITDASTTTTSSSSVSSFTQKAQWSFNFTPSALSPWLGSVSVNRLAVSMAWLSALNETLKASESSALFAVDPARYFFYPNILRPVDVSLSFKGGLLPSSKKTDASKDGQPALVLRSPWASDDAAETAKPEDGQNRGASTGAAPSPNGAAFRLPKRVPSFATVTTSSSPWSVTWTLEPSAYIEQRFLSGEWKGPGDIDMSELLYDLQSYHLAASLASSYAAPNGAFSGSFSMGWVSQDQTRTTTDNAAYASLVSSYRLADNEYRLSKLTSSLKLTTKPFADFWLLSPSTLGYTLEGYLFEYAYGGLDAVGDPLYTTLTPAWNSTMVSSHAAAALLGINTGASVQSVGLTMSLPPTSESYTGTVNLAAAATGWKLSAALKGRAYRATSPADFSWDPLTTTISMTTPFGLSLSDTLAYDSVLGAVKANTATLGWGPFSASLAAGLGHYYYPVIGSGWVAYTTEEELVFSSFKAAFSKTWKNPPGAPLAASFSVDASYNQNLLQFSNSILGLSLSLTFKVTDLIDVSFKSVSQNSSAWRYCPWLFPAVEKTGYTADDYFTNPLTDILDGFAFWDTGARTSSLFKLKSLSVSVAHDLHDWNLSFSLTSAPTLDTSSTPYKYILESKFSVLLAWKDVSQIKAKLSKDSDGYSF